VTTPAWQTNHLDLSSIKLTADNGTIGGYVLPTDMLPAVPGQLLSGTSSGGMAAAVAVGPGLSLSSGTLSATYSYTLPVATSSALGGVKQGAGVAIAADGTISASSNSGVSTFNTRSGAVTLTLTDVTTVTGKGATATTNFGLAAVAASGAYADLSGKPAIAALTSVLPQALGTAAVGISTASAHADHVHPLPTSFPVANLSQSGAIVGQMLAWNGQGWTPTTIAGSPSPIASGTVLANASGSSAMPTETTLSALLDNVMGSVQGEFIFRGISGWAVLAPGPSGYLLQTGGSAGNPSWVAPPNSSSISGVLVDGSTVPASSSSPYQMQTGDRVLAVLKKTGAATAITLPISPTLWMNYAIIDAKGDAGTNNIVVTVPNSGTINGAAKFVLSANRDAISFLAINSTTWVIT